MHVQSCRFMFSGVLAANAMAAKARVKVQTATANLENIVDIDR